MSKTKQNYLFKIVLTSLMIALNVIMERFLSYNVWNLSIGFSFITVAFAAVFLGVPYAIAVGALGDIIGALLFPFGTYFFGFTLTNIIMAAITGIFMWRSTNVIKIGISVLLNKLLCTVTLNSIWIAILYKGGLGALWAVIIPRLPSAGAMLVIETVVLTLLFADNSRIKQTLNTQFKKYGI